MRKAQRAAVMASIACAVLALVASGVGGRTRAAAQATYSCGLLTKTPAIVSVMPTAFYASDGQTGADCMAWQEFVAINWAADPQHPGEPNSSAAPSSFGAPGDMTPKVWETYVTPTSAFAPGSTLASALRASSNHALSATSKLDDEEVELSGITEAFTNSWLTDQNKGLTYYEIRLNNDEAQYITQNKLGTEAGQITCVKSAHGFNLPQGKNDYTCANAPFTYGDGVGAVEVKAAWIVLTDPAQYGRFLTAQATIVPPTGPSYQGIVGLTGLHIIHKVPQAQQFVWATFEHIDNDPTSGQSPAPGAAFNYNNPTCDPTTDYYRCKPNAQPTSPAPYTAPVQVLRSIAIGPIASSLNAYMRGIMPGDSVFRHYELVDVLWPNQNTTIQPNATVPLTTGDSTTETPPYMANTTMETYYQTKFNCMDCHRSGQTEPASSSALHLAHGATGRMVRLLRLPNPKARTGSGTAYASDYSMIFFSSGK